MKKILLGSAIILGIAAWLFIGVACYFYFVVFGNADRTLAKNLTVTNEWTELSIDPAVKPSYTQQTVWLRPVNFKVDRDEKGFEIRLPDGTVIEPEVEIYDEQGNKFQLRKSGFTMGWNDYVVFSRGSKDNDYAALPRNRTYRSLRIRSDVPFVCESITWIDYSPP